MSDKLLHRFVEIADTLLRWLQFEQATRLISGAVAANSLTRHPCASAQFYPGPGFLSATLAAAARVQFARYVMQAQTPPRLIEQFQRRPSPYSTKDRLSSKNDGPWIRRRLVASVMPDRSSGQRPLAMKVVAADISGSSTDAAAPVQSSATPQSG